VVGGREGGFDGETASVDVYKKRKLFMIWVCDFWDVDSSRNPCFLIDHDVFRLDAGGWIGRRGDDSGAEESLYGAVFVDPNEVWEIDDYFGRG